jgi:hypothetical protein
MTCALSVLNVEIERTDHLRLVWLPASPEIAWLYVYQVAQKRHGVRVPMSPRSGEVYMYSSCPEAALCTCHLSCPEVATCWYTRHLEEKQKASITLA